MALIQDKIPAITEFLQRQGCEIIPVTSEYELLRYKGRQVGIIYKSGNVSGDHVTKMLRAFNSGVKWDGAPKSTKRIAYGKHKEKLLKRDGDHCFYCSLPMGDDITVEHLIPLTAGGLNLLSNMVLAHKHCNDAMGFKPLYEKVKYAVEVRLLIG